MNAKFQTQEQNEKRTYALLADDLGRVAKHFGRSTDEILSARLQLRRNEILRELWRIQTEISEFARAN